MKVVGLIGIQTAFDLQRLGIYHAAKCLYPRPSATWARALRSRANWERRLPEAVFSMCVIIKRGWKPSRATTYSHIGQLPIWELTIWLSVWPCNAPVATAVQRSSILTIWLFYHAAAPHKGAATALAL